MDITVNCVHPGLVKTALIHSDYACPMNLIVPIVDFFIGESPDQAADIPVWLALSNEVRGINGEYIHQKKSRIVGLQLRIKKPNINFTISLYLCWISGYDKTTIK
jgi:hypothetical protein